MKDSDNVGLRFNARVDLVGLEDGQQEAALLMSASRGQAYLRVSSPKKEGDKIRLFCEPNMKDSFSIESTVNRCRWVQLPDKDLDYYELEIRIDDMKTFGMAIEALRETSFELKEDVRLILSVPVVVESEGGRIEATSGNLSFSGLFVNIDEEKDMPAAGDTVHLTVTFPKPDYELAIRGAVVYAISPEQAGQFSQSPGIGIHLSGEGEAIGKWREAVRRTHGKAI